MYLCNQIYLNNLAINSFGNASILDDKENLLYIKPSGLNIDNLKINDNEIDQRDIIRSKKIGIIYQDKNLLADYISLNNPQALEN